MVGTCFTLSLKCVLILFDPYPFNLMSPHDIFFNQTLSQTFIENFNVCGSKSFQNWPKLIDINSLYNFFGVGFVETKTKRFISIPEFTRQYGLSFKHQRYDYTGTNPLDSCGRPLVNESPYDVVVLNTIDLMRCYVDVTLRWVTLLNNICTEKVTGMVTGPSFVLTSGSILSTYDEYDWCFVNGPPLYSPFATIIDTLYQTLKMSNSRGPLDVMEFAKLLPLEDICESISNGNSVDKDLVLLWGIANDLGRSKGCPHNQTSRAGSAIIDNIAKLTQHPVLSGGDGTEGYIWTTQRKAKELIKSIAYFDYQQVRDTELSVRTSMFFFNYLTFGELLHDRGFRLNLETIKTLGEQISIQYSSILQSTVKSSSPLTHKATTILSTETARFLGLDAQHYQLTGVNPLTKFQPAIYNWDNESQAVSLKRHSVSVTPIDSEQIHVYLG
jgi:hypothetical protein